MVQNHFWKNPFLTHFSPIFGLSTPTKYLTEGVPSNIWWVYSPQIFDGRGSVKYLVGLHPPSI